MASDVEALLDTGPQYVLGALIFIYHSLTLEDAHRV